MLEVDLDATDMTLELAIAKACAAYGRVVSVKVHRTPSPFALVEMAQREQSYEVAANHGGSGFGTSALVHLVQKPV
jgi:hypothetical protein